MSEGMRMRRQTDDIHNSKYVCNDSSLAKKKKKLARLQGVHRDQQQQKNK